MTGDELFEACVHDGAAGVLVWSPGGPHRLRDGSTVLVRTHRGARCTRVRPREGNRAGQKIEAWWVSFYPTPRCGATGTYALPAELRLATLAEQRTPAVAHAMLVAPEGPT